jgi:hypothetical protein
MSQIDDDHVEAPIRARDRVILRQGVGRGATVGAAGAAATVLSGFLVALMVQPRSDVSDVQFSFPWTAGELVPVSVLYALLHAMVLVGVWALISSGLTGSTRAARAGAWLGAGGTALLIVAELASIAVRDQAMSDAGAGLVGALFGVATAVTTLGFLLLGVTTLTSHRWSGWGRFTPLAVGLTLVALMGLVMTPALAAGVGLYGLALLVTFLALAQHERV